MVRAKYMKLLLYMTVIFGVDAGGSTEKHETATTSSKPSQVSQDKVVTHKSDSPNDHSHHQGTLHNQNRNNQQCNRDPKAECSSSPDITKLECFREIQITCPKKFQNKETSKAFNKQEEEIIHNIMNTTNTTKIWKLRDLDIAVVKINSNTTESFIPINASELFNDTQAAQIWVPEESFENVSKEMHKVGVVSYDSVEQFTLELGNSTIMSKVTRIEVPGQDILNLTDLLRIQFPVNMTTDNNIYSCQFFEEDLQDNKWSDRGCFTKIISDYIVECSCNHMTAFAVLMVEPKDPDKEHWEIMSYISYIGCGLSTVFSGCSILIYIINSNGRKEVSRSIHVSLSAALFLLNISFMLSDWAATLNENDVCVFVAVAIHYSLLCCFTWMAIEALHLYILLVRVFNIYIKHYMAKLSLIGWGVPAIIIGCLLTVHSSHPLYGIKKIKLSDVNKTNEICWTKDASIPYAVNMSYFVLIFLFNTGTLITVSIKIFMLRKADIKSKTVNVYKNVSTVLGLMCLLGTTWGLVFFTSGYTNYPILYLFCILNSMQGFYIFLWMCLTSRPEKQHTDQKSTFTMDTYTSDNHKQNSIIKT